MLSVKHQNEKTTFEYHLFQILENTRTTHRFWMTSSKYLWEDLTTKSDNLQFFRVSIVIERL